MAKGFKTGGRVKGVPNKTTAQIREIARKFAPLSIVKLAEMAGIVPGKRGSKVDAVRVSAHREILDRGLGKAAQEVSVRRITALQDLDEDELAALAHGGGGKDE